jgi:hypothetical protein
MNDTCHHGQLRRQCNICELEEEVARLRQENDRLRSVEAAAERLKDGREAEEIKWLPGWYANRLHALPADKVPPGHQQEQSLCGQYVYSKAHTDWAQRRLDNGVPHCKWCEKLLAKRLEKARK